MLVRWLRPKAEVGVSKTEWFIVGVLAAFGFLFLQIMVKAIW